MPVFQIAANRLTFRLARKPRSGSFLTVYTSEGIWFADWRTIAQTSLNGKPSIILDATFRALADPTRRVVVARLTRGPAPVKELAEPFDMGLPSFMKHLMVLERDGLITSKKIGRVRTCRVNTERLAAAETWLSQQRELWQGRTDRLADFAENHTAESSDDAD